MAHRPGKPKVTTIQIKGQPVRVCYRWGHQYLAVEDLERAVGQPPGTFEAWRQTPEGQAVEAAVKRQLARKPEAN